MMHILKWRYQADKRSTSWVRTIVNARQETRSLQEYMPLFTQEHVETIWQRNFEAAITAAKVEMNVSFRDTFISAALT